MWLERVLKSKIQKSSLSELTIRNLGVIESAEIEFGEGLTVLTGETGAGKTMVLTALNLILGAKSDADFVRNGGERLVVSGKFKLNNLMATKVEEVGGFIENGEVILNRSVTNQGKSKISLGGVITTASQVSELAEELVEIHAQASSARLNKSSIQCELLDAFGDYQGILESYGSTFTEYVQLRKRVSDLKAQISVRDVEIAKLQGLVGDFAKVAPKKGELHLVENEINRLGSVEDLNTGVVAGLSAISSEEDSALSALNIAKKYLENLRGKDSELDGLIDNFVELVYEINETSSGLERYLARLEADPVKFDQLQMRKSEILTLIKRYGKGNERDLVLDNLFIEAAEATSKLLDLEGGDSRLAELISESEKVFAALQTLAKSLSKARRIAAQELSKAITAELTELAMPNSRLTVEVTARSEDMSASYSATGLDEIAFLFTSHAEGKLLPLNKAASGGELSRVMLAIEVVLAKNSTVGTYIFDEVDAGVGGKAAVEVGKRLALLAKNSQVIVITHLAQVASWADRHLVVTKSENSSVTQSNVIEVTGSERRKEIARLLSGQDESISAQEHAGELLELVAAARREMIG
ncbi:MAG: DNA repair protein RecN [Actinomycetales bacterium]|nr:MAG: DNA repair protein RecN [Actinomycetales bacterium]